MVSNEVHRENEHLRIKTKPEQQAKGGAGQAQCSARMTRSRKAPWYTEPHSLEALLMVGSKFLLTPKLESNSEDTIVSSLPVYHSLSHVPFPFLLERVQLEMLWGSILTHAVTAYSPRFASSARVQGRMPDCQGQEDLSDWIASSSAVLIAAYYKKLHPVTCSENALG